MKFIRIVTTLLFLSILLGNGSVSVMANSQALNTNTFAHTFLSESQTNTLNSSLITDASTIVQQFPEINKLKLSYQSGFIFVEINTDEKDVTDVQWLNEAMHEINNSVTLQIKNIDNQKSSSIQYKLFINGSAYEAFLTDEKLDTTSETSDIKPQTDNLSVVLSPGHGWYYNTWARGWRLQRVWYNGIVEDYINSTIVQELKTKLDPLFSPINSTRELDVNAGNLPETGFPLWQMSAYKNLEYKGLPASVWNDDGGSKTEETNYAKDIRSRGLYTNYIEADAMISIHNNGGGGCGTETLYDSTNGYGNRSFLLANTIQYKIIDTLRKNWDANWCDRGTKGFDGNYGENRIFKGPAALVEIAFMDRVSENNALQSPVFRNLVTDAIRDGLVEYYNLPLSTLTYPADNTRLEVGQNLVVTADATSKNGTIDYVDFYQSTTFIGRDSNGSDGWSTPYTVGNYGGYAFWTVATDTDGKYGRSLVNYSFVTDEKTDNNGDLRLIVTENDIVSAAGRFWQILRTADEKIVIRYSFNKTNWSEWLPTYSAYTYSPMIYTSIDNRLMVVTKSLDGKTEARFTSNGTDWEWFDNLTPATSMSTRYITSHLIR